LLNTALGNLPFLNPGAFTRLTALLNALSNPFANSSFDAEKEITTFKKSIIRHIKLYF